MNMDIYDELTESVSAIKSDPLLRDAFLRVLSIGSYTQQVRVDKIREHIASRNPPEKVMTLLRLLRDDKIANLVYSELSK